MYIYFQIKLQCTENISFNIMTKYLDADFQLKITNLDVFHLNTVHTASTAQ